MKREVKGQCEGDEKGWGMRFSGGAVRLYVVGRAGWVDGSCFRMRKRMGLEASDTGRVDRGPGARV